MLTIRTFTAVPSTTIGTTSVKTWSPGRVPAGAAGSIRWERWSCQAYSPLPGGATSAQSGSAAADALSGIELPPYREPLMYAAGERRFSYTVPSAAKRRYGSLS